MDNQRGLGVKPFGALGAVVTAQTGQVFWCLCILVLLEMLRGQEIGFDLVNVSAQSRSVGQVVGVGTARTYLLYRLVFVMVRLFGTPILKPFVDGADTVSG